MTIETVPWKRAARRSIATQWAYLRHAIREDHIKGDYEMAAIRRVTLRALEEHRAWLAKGQS